MWESNPHVSVLQTAPFTIPATGHNTYFTAPKIPTAAAKIDSNTSVTIMIPIPIPIGIHKGDNTQIQDHAITPVNFNATNKTVSKTPRGAPET